MQHAAQLMPGGPIKHAARAISMLRQRRGSSAIAAPYHALAQYPAGTLGNAFYRFHRNRGFALPGEPLWKSNICAAQQSSARTVWMNVRQQKFPFAPAKGRLGLQAPKLIPLSARRAS